jgi:hypothetical protein
MLIFLHSLLLGKHADVRITPSAVSEKIEAAVPR